MRKIAFILTILGMLVLFSILLFQKPILINSPEELTKQIPNQLVQAKGTITQENTIKNSKILLLDNNLKASCDLYCPKYLNKSLTIIGTYDEFYSQIKILEIKEIN
jgi:uncharacterized membrane protein SpoIIM required for sporulation